jgi:hypothetical protein
MKRSEAFTTRTVRLENASQSQQEAGGALTPVLYTAAPPVADGRLQAITSIDSTHLHDVSKLNIKLAGVIFAGGCKLKIMGIQDNYKPWSRKNWRNGKVVVLDPTSPCRHLCFDDYSFTKTEEDMGTYIYSLYDAAGKPIDGTRAELQALYSAEPAFRKLAGNVPTIFTAVLNKKGVTDTAVDNKEYFVQRLSAALGR